MEMEVALKNQSLCHIIPDRVRPYWAFNFLKERI